MKILQDAGFGELPVRRRRMCKIKHEAHGGTCPQVDFVVRSVKPRDMCFSNVQNRVNLNLLSSRSRVSLMCKFKAKACGRN